MTVTAPAATLNRDRWGRPLIVPPGGGKAVAYTRVTTLAKTLEEQSALTAWKQRMTLVGASLQPHLMLAVAAHRDDRSELNRLAEEAMKAAQAGAKAEIGTAIHALTEKIDRDEDPGPFPAEYASTIKAYRDATADLAMLEVERFVVLDEIQVAGTTDRVVSADGWAKPRIADIKTGSIDYAGMAIAIQLACYARGVRYDVETTQRQEMDLDQQVGIVIHLPAGEGTCTRYEVDLEAGWAAVEQSLTVRDLRKKKDWMQQCIPTQRPAVDLRALIAAATSTDELGQLWKDHAHEWTPDLTDLAAARHALIAGGLVDTQTPDTDR